LQRPCGSGTVAVPWKLKAYSRTRIRRSKGLCWAKSEISEEERVQRDKQVQEVLQSRVETAGKLLDDMIDDIVCDLSTVHSVGYIYEEVPQETEAEIIKKVVKRFFNRLDQNFLASLEKFQKRSKDMGHPDVARLIAKIRAEVVSQTNDQFPPEILLLEDLMKMPDKADRIAKIKQVAEMTDEEQTDESAEKSVKDSPTDPNIYVDVVEDSLEDMDLAAELERLKVMKSSHGLKTLKEELEKELAAVDQGEQKTSDFDEVMGSVEDPLEDFEPEQKEDIRHEYGKRIDPLQVGLVANQFISDIEEKEEIANRQLLAKLCVIREEARLVEMEMRFKGASMEEDPLKLRENVSSQVMGIIQMLIKTGDPIKRVGLIRKVFEKDDYGPSVKDYSRPPGYVRPGSFMTALTMTQLEADGRSKQEMTASEIAPKLLQRIDDIRLEAMLVLREMGWGEFSSDELAQKQKEREEMQKKIKEEYLSQK